MDSRMMGCLLVAEGIAGGRILEAHRRGDIAGVAGLDLLPVIGVHLQDAPDALLVVLVGIVAPHEPALTEPE
jgi:hypothetical protein